MMDKLPVIIGILMPENYTTHLPKKFTEDHLKKRVDLVKEVLHAEDAGFVWVVAGDFYGQLASRERRTFRDRLAFWPDVQKQYEQFREDGGLVVRLPHSRDELVERCRSALVSAGGESYILGEKRI